MTKEQRKRMKKEKRNHRKKNGGVKTKTSNHSKDRVPNHRFGVEPSIPLTSNELRERNEIKSHEDLGSVENICFLDWRYEGQTIWDEENGESIPHGYGKETFHNISSTQEEEISYEGGFKNGKRDGYGRVELNTGATYEGSFKDGLRHGNGYSNFKNAHNFIQSGRDLIEVREEWSNNRLFGMMEYVYEDGATTILPASFQNQFTEDYESWDVNKRKDHQSFGAVCVS